MLTLVLMVSVINAVVQNTVKTTGSTEAEVMESQPNIVAGNAAVFGVGVLGGTADAKVKVQDIEHIPSNFVGFWSYRCSSTQIHGSCQCL